MQKMAETIGETTARLDREELARFFREILSAQRIYVTGAGRSGFVAKAFAMRLMHLGYNAYVVGETITPALRSGDTLVIFSGSGETQSIATYGETAKELGAAICLITASKESRMGRIADCMVHVGESGSYHRKNEQTFELRQITGQYRSTSSQMEIREVSGEYRSTIPAFAPLGTLFETMALVFSDAVISALMEAKMTEISDMADRLSTTE
jgi:6-phospho-3-hexuloisomerase